MRKMEKHGDNLFSNQWSEIKTHALYFQSCGILLRNSKRRMSVAKIQHHSLGPSRTLKGKETLNSAIPCKKPEQATF